MKTILAFILALFGAGHPSLATAPNLPCASGSLVVTVSRPPTSAELVGEPPAWTGPLQMMLEQWSCNGSAWTQIHFFKQYKGTQQPVIVQVN